MRVTPWDPSVQHRFVTSDGTALYVHDTGSSATSLFASSSSASAGVTVVLAHGWTLDHTSWDRVATLLPGRVLRYDHRGHGGSAPGEPATIERAADDLAELIEDRVPTGPVVLVGHSMGGMAAMALAERHTELFASRIAAVGLVATSSGGLSELTFGLPAWLARRVRTAERRINGRIARSRRATLGAPPAAGLRWLLFGAGARKADVLATAEQVGRCHPASMVGFRASLNEHERRVALAAMRNLPVTILAGGADRLTPPSHARAIADELPRARFVTYPQAGHMLPYERAAEVATHVRALIDQAA